MNKLGFLACLALCSLLMNSCSSPSSPETELLDSTIVFDDGVAVTRTIGSGYYLNGVSGVGAGEITYSSGTESTATVDINNGEVTLHAVGTSIITAHKAATSTHAAVTAAYTLTVTDLIPSTIVFDDGIAITRIIGSGYYLNGVSGVGTGDITYSSGTESTAAIDENTGEVTLFTVGSTIITAHKAATATHAAVDNAYTLTVKGIGSPYQGGIIAYILQSGDSGYSLGEAHGLIVGSSNLSSGLVWSLTAATVPGAVETAIGFGNATTGAIVMQNNIGATYAAGFCDAFTNPHTGTGVYNDWYLPTKDELFAIYINRDAIGGIVPTTYWTSTEYDSTKAWYIYFGNGSQSYTDKTTALNYILPVRSF